jgi:hypothetical protein
MPCAVAGGGPGLPGIVPQVRERMAAEPLAIGSAAGFGGDRTDAARPVVETLVARGGPGVLIFEMLAERTLAMAQLERRANPDRGYAPLLEPMVRPVQVARAALLGLHTTGFPVSPLTPATFLIVGLAWVDLGDHQRLTIPFLFGASVLMTLAAVAFGIFPF